VTLLAPTLQAFFTDRLLTQRQASPRTVAAYRDTLRLLLDFAQQRTATQPCRLDLAELNAELITAFLTHLEHDRGNSVRTRNARLAAIHSLFRFAALHHPEHAELIARVLAIPAKRYHRALVHFLTPAEVDALLAAPDRSTWLGRRDHALLVLAIQSGLRVSELTSLTIANLHLGDGPHVRCHGKGRKERATPLTRQTLAILRAWMRERSGAATDPVFPTRQGHPLSVDAIQWLLAKHTRTAADNCPSLRTKNVSPHVLRHTCAMNLLQSGVDTATIALWLGHSDIRTTQTYLHADLALKERALARTTPPNTAPGRYKPSDTLLAFLEQL
jgi:site-specific recombinase XerD